MKFKSVILSAFVLMISSVSFSQTTAIDDAYRFIGLKTDSYEFAKHSLILDQGQIKIKADDEATEKVLPLALEEGAQEEFQATLKKELPAGINLYKGELDIKGDGVLKKITIVKQMINEAAPRLTIYIVENGRPYAIIKAYDRTQESALNAAWDDVK